MGLLGQEVVAVWPEQRAGDFRYLKTPTEHSQRQQKNRVQVKLAEFSWHPYSSVLSQNMPVCRQPSCWATQGNPALVSSETGPAPWQLCQHQKKDFKKQNKGKIYEM